MLCRLCCYESNDDSAISLFGDEEESNLIKLIAKYLQIEVTQFDSYSKEICCDCYTKLNDFHKYFQHVEQRQNWLQNYTLKDPKENQLKDVEDAVQEEYGRNCDESPLDIKGFLIEKDNIDVEHLIPEVEFAYASLDENVGVELNEEKDDKDVDDDDEDDQPLKKLVPDVCNDDIQKRKVCKTRQKKKASSRKRKPSRLKLKSNKKQIKNPIRESDNKTNDSVNCTKQTKNPYSAEEDKLSEELIAKHMQLKCEICDVVVSSYRNLRTHFRTEHNSRPFVTCCGKRFLQRFLLVDHINTHLNPDQFKCKVCGKVFKSRICISVHMANKHANRDQMRHCCDICGKRFSHPSILRTHLLVHSQERNFGCEVCKKAFKSSHMLKAHTQHMHGEKSPYVCDTCGKEYRFKLSFDRHVAEHQGLLKDQQQQCHICNGWFSSNYLRRHVKRHDLEDVDCEKCGKTFKSKVALASHMEYSHRIRRTYSCTFCDKTFERALNLKEHIDMHTGRKEYICAHCPREFRSRANMYAHVKKIHFEQWKQAQLERHKGPSNNNDKSNESTKVQSGE